MSEQAVEQVAEVAAVVAPSVVDQAARELLTWVQGTRELITAEAPDLARQILEWGWYDTILDLAWDLPWMLLGLGLLFKAFQVYRLQLPLHRAFWAQETSTQQEENQEAGRLGRLALFSLPGLAVSLITFGAILSNVAVLVQIQVAPKVYLLGYLKRLLS